MYGQAPSVLDDVQGRLPSGLRWVFAGVGGAAGFSYALQHGSTVAASCVVAGAALGFAFIAALFGGLRLVRGLVLVALLLVVVNYAVLVPFGYGDHTATWLAVASRGAAAVLDALMHLVNCWLIGMR